MISLIKIHCHSRIKNRSPSVGATPSDLFPLVPQLVERSFCDQYLEDTVHKVTTTNPILLRVNNTHLEMRFGPLEFQ
jgi:hypothetical protein